MTGRQDVTLAADGAGGDQVNNIDAEVGIDHLITRRASTRSGSQSVRRWPVATNILELVMTWLPGSSSPTTVKASPPSRAILYLDAGGAVRGNPVRAAVRVPAHPGVISPSPTCPVTTTRSAAVVEAWCLSSRRCRDRGAAGWRATPTRAVILAQAQQAERLGQLWHPDDALDREGRRGLTDPGAVLLDAEDGVQSLPGADLTRQSITPRLPGARPVPLF